jgi:hypothetical protein
MGVPEILETVAGPEILDQQCLPSYRNSVTGVPDILESVFAFWNRWLVQKFWTISVCSPTEIL